MTDPIADFLTRVRNAYSAGNRIVEIPSSKMKVALTKILCEKGYILSYKVVEGTPSSTIKIALKYHPQTKQAAIKKIVRVSKPGLRKYTDVAEKCHVFSTDSESLSFLHQRVSSLTKRLENSTSAVKLYAMFINI